MAGSGFVKVSYPWDATIDLSSPEPARFYVSLIAQTLEYGAPAARRFGPLWALAGRAPLPEGTIAAILRRAGAFSTKAVPPVETDPILDAWERLMDVDPRLPSRPKTLSTLQLTRASAVTTFLFSGSDTPLLVGKKPRGEGASVGAEVAALEAAHRSGVAPIYLGSVAGTELQRGLTGRAMKVEPIGIKGATRLAWTQQHRSLAEGFERLADTTVKHVPPSAMSDGIIEAALEHPGLSDITRRAISEAHDAFRDLPVSVLRHTDTSPQNILFEGNNLVGLVDWADATHLGMPGADMWNAALACIDKGVARVRLDERTLLLSFLGAWFTSDFGTESRRAGADAAVVAGVPEDLVGLLELLFFARRVGHRMKRPDEFLVSADLAARMLEHVRARPFSGEGPA